MQNFKLKIDQNCSCNDLTIIYKEGENQLHELKVSQKDILNNLQVFQKKSHEINLTHLIYIQEEIPFDIFEQFIISIKTKEIDINDQNYKSFLYLSQKYEYEDLYQSITNFISNRPDISNVIDDLIKLSSNIDQKTVERDFNKEELLAKNLDICLQNKNMLKMSIDTIYRILHSPQRVINDYHLLFSFVIEFIQSKMNFLNKEDEENISLIPRCLDYCLMSNDEIETLFSIEKKLNVHFFSPQNSEGTF